MLIEIWKVKNILKTLQTKMRKMSSDNGEVDSSYKVANKLAK
jgi:hypothetical protein